MAFIWFLVKFLLIVCFYFFGAANRLEYCCCVSSGWSWNKCVLWFRVFKDSCGWLMLLGWKDGL